MTSLLKELSTVPCTEAVTVERGDQGLTIQIPDSALLDYYLERFAVCQLSVADVRGMCERGDWEPIDWMHSLTQFTDVTGIESGIEGVLLAQLKAIPDQSLKQLIAGR